MIRTIQQRIYVVGMLPLALLAVTLSDAQRHRQDQ